MALSPEIVRELTESRRAPGEGDGATIELPVEYKRGEPPPDYPSKVLLTAPPWNEDHLVARRCLDEKCEAPILLACLPPPLAMREFIDLLTFNCYALLVDRAMVLVFGERTCDCMVEADEKLNNPQQFFAT